MLLFGFPLWILLTELILFTIFVVVVQCEYYGWSTVIFIVSLLSLQFLAKIPLILYIKKNPLGLFMWSGIYFVLAISWSFTKWISFLYKFKEIRNEKLEDFYTEQNEAKQKRKNLELKIKNITEDGNPNIYIIQSEIRNLLGIEKKTDWDFLASKRYRFSLLSESPKFRDYKSQIIGWAVFFIPSFIGTLLDDFVRRIVTFIINRFRTFYEWLSNKIVGDFPKASNG